MERAARIRDRQPTNPPRGGGGGSNRDRRTSDGADNAPGPLGARGGVRDMRVSAMHWDSPMLTFEKK